MKKTDEMYKIKNLNSFFKLQNQIRTRLNLSAKLDHLALHSKIGLCWHAKDGIVYFAASPRVFYTNPAGIIPRIEQYSVKLRRGDYVIFVTDMGLLMFHVQMGIENKEST